MNTIGERIREYRKRAGLSQVDLAKKTGVSKQTIYKYETGVITNIPSDKIEQVAAACDISPALLMGWDTVQENGQPEYYIDPETAALAQKLLTDSNYRILFDAARGSRPEDIMMVADLLRRFKEERND